MSGPSSSMLSDPEICAIDLPQRAGAPLVDADGLPEAHCHDIRVLPHLHPAEDVEWMFPAAVAPDVDIDYEDFEVEAGTRNPVMWSGKVEAKEPEAYADESYRR